MRHSLLAGFLFFGLLLGRGAGQTPKEKIDKWIPQAAYQRKAEHTFIFSRAQFKFGLVADDYFNRYVDRPLFLDPENHDPASRFKSMAEASLLYGMDGLAFFPQNTGNMQAYEFTSAAPKGFTLLTEGTSKTGGFNFLEEALKNPASMRIKGKLVVSCYGAERKPVEHWAKLIAEAKKRYGDQFIFLPDVANLGGIPLGSWIRDYYAGTLSEQRINVAKEYLRQWLRATDGIYFSATTVVRDENRNFAGDFYREFMIRIMKSVLAEPEFQDKYLGLSAKIGHENHTRVGRTLNSNGTRTLRDSLQSALDAKPDILNIPEWDEMNESTSLEPTVYDGTSSMRILRYYSAKARNEEPAVLPGDDSSQPNLIVSWRKLLAMGEKLEIELLNVPDAADSSSFGVAVTLEDLSGKTVYTSPTFRFRRDELEEHRVTLPSESLGGHSILRPKLTITEGDRITVIENGLHYIEIRPTWNWDYKWVKTPIRDVLKASEAKLTMTPADNGLQTIDFKFACDEPLASLEILENDNVIYRHAPKDADLWRDNSDQVVFSLAWKSSQHGDFQTLRGSLTLEDGNGRWLLPPRTGEAGVDIYALQGQTLSLDGQRSNLVLRRVLLAIPKENIESAVLNVDIPDVYKGSIPVKKIVKEGAFGIAGAKGFNLIISRFLRQSIMPPDLNTNGEAFTLSTLPDWKGSVFHLQAIAKSGRIYRSVPIVPGGEGKDEKEIAVFSEDKNEPVTVQVDASRVPDIRYDFTPEHGSILMTDAGRPFCGILGGYATLITERSGAPGDGTPFLVSEHPADAKETAPQWVSLPDGGHALRFNGESTYVTLPQGVIPRRAGYMITMDVFPETTKGKQVLIANFASRFGTLALFLDEGTLKVRLQHDLGHKGAETDSTVNSELQVKAGEWSTLSIRFDQSEVTFSVNGQEKSLPLQGPGMHDTVSVIGGLGQEWFNGLIKSLRIEHGGKLPPSKD